MNFLAIFYYGYYDIIDMQRVLIIFYIFILLFSTFAGIRPGEKVVSLDYIPYMATHLDKSTGLPHLDLKKMVQDRFGFLYFSSWGKGFFRFDGADWVNFPLDSEDPLDNRIIDMAYDGRDYLYLLHPSEGLYRFDVTREKGEKLSLNLGRLTTRFTRVHVTSSGTMVLLTSSGGFYTYDPGTGVVNYHSGSSSRLNNFDPGWRTFDAAYSDSSGRTWLGAENGIMLFDGTEVEEYFPFINKMRQQVHQIIELPDKKILVFTDRFIGVVDEEEKNIKPFSGIHGASLLLEIYKAAPVSCFIFSGAYFYFTSGGAIIYDPSENRSYKLNEANKLLIDNYVNSVFIDREGNIWVTTLKGVTLLKKSSFLNFTSMEGISVSNANIFDSTMLMVGDVVGEAQLYFPADRFAVRFSGDKAYIADLSLLSVAEKVKIIFPENGESVIRLYNAQNYRQKGFGNFVREGTVPKGLFLLENEKYMFRYFDTGSSYRGLHVLEKESGDEEVIVLPDLQLKPETAELYFINPEKTKLMMLQKTDVAKVFFVDLPKRKMNRLYMENELKILFNPERDRLNIKVAFDGGAGLWIAYNSPSARLFRYSEGTYMDYTEKFELNGLMITDMDSDSRGSLYITTANEGLFLYKEETLFKYTTADGLDNNSLTGGIAITWDDEVYVLSETAISLFREPAKQMSIPDFRFIYLEDMQGKQESRFLVGTEDKMILPPGLRDLWVQVSAMCFQGEKRNRYSYFLKGRDEEWSVPAEDYRISLVSLKPGNYELKVRVTGCSGQDTEGSLFFEIPPFWYELSFVRITSVILFVLFGLLLLRLGIYWNTRRLRSRNLLLESLVEEKTAELKEKQQQLTQAAYASGKSEVAAEILHTVGNVLNSVSLRVEESSMLLRKKSILGLGKANELLEQEYGHLEKTSKQEMLLKYYRTLGDELERENGVFSEKIDSIQEYLIVIQNVIRRQEQYTEAPVFSEALDLAELIEDSLELFSQKLKGIRIERLYSQEKSFVIEGHKPRLIHILGNLYINAVEAMSQLKEPEKAISINLGQEGRQTFLSVSDRGIGIPEEHLIHIFNFGFSTKQIERAYGFSLHSCANFMAEMNGRIKAESDGPGKGARFTLFWEKRNL